MTLATVLTEAADTAMLALLGMMRAEDAVGVEMGEMMVTEACGLILSATMLRPAVCAV